MRKIFSVAMAMAGALFSAAQAEAEKEGGVLVLTDANFDEELAKHEYLLVEFYAPWCGHCKKLAPEYEAAAGILAARDPPRYIAKVDTTKEEALGKRFSIQGFPTLKWFVDGKDSEYNGGRVTDDIVKWIVKKTGPASDAVDCAALADKASAALNLIFFGDHEGAAFDNFMSAAKSPDLEKFTFFHTGKDCAKDFGVEAPGVAIQRNFDEPKVAYTGEHEVEALTAWAKTHAVPTIFEFSEDHIEPIFQNRQAAVFLFSEDKDAAYQKVFNDAAHAHKGKILFSTTGVSSGIQERLGEFLGVTKDDMPTMRIVEPGADLKKYMFDGDVNAVDADAIGKWIDSFKAGSLSPHRKSEAAPEDNNGPVKIVVGTEWEKIVADETKDVLMEYYAPWCGHCKALAPKWDELGEHVKDIDDLVIAKMDSTANEVEAVEIRGYPTLKWYPKGNKKGEDYNEGRELPDFKKFLMENSASYKAKFGEADAEPVKADAETKSEEL